MGAVCSWNSSSVLSHLFFFMSCCWVQNSWCILSSSSWHRKTVVKYCWAEASQSMKVNCWTLDLHPHFRSRAATSVRSMLNKSVWFSNTSMSPVAFSWFSSSKYFHAKSYSYEYPLQKWTRILVYSSGYPTACMRVIFGLAERVGICYVCTWAVIMRTGSRQKITWVQSSMKRENV